MKASPHLRHLGMVQYEAAYTAQLQFTQTRSAHTADEIWLLQHPPAFTLGLNSKPEHLLNVGDIPVVQTDRGGQVTYHAPGQLVVYCLLDLKRAGLNIKRVVHGCEQAVLDLLAGYGVAAARRAHAPGVYVNGAKICALGLRIRRGYCYHGLALNVDLDLSPYARINPCGYAGLQVTQLRDLGVLKAVHAVAQDLLPHLLSALNLSDRALVA